MKKRADGRYVKKVTLPDRTKKYIYGKNKTEITQKEREILKAFESGVKLDDNTKLNEWFIEWFQTYKSKLRYKTQEVYTNAYETHIRLEIGDLFLKGVRPVHIQSVMNGVADKSESLQRKVLTTMRQLFQTAKLNHLILTDPTEGIKITKNTKPDKIKFLTKEQQDELISAVIEPRAKVFCALCLYAGLRREEALGLQWSDIENNKMTIRRAITFKDNQPDTNQNLKSKAANRTIPIPSNLADILSETPRKGLYIITQINGDMITKTSFRRMWEHVTKVVSFHVYPHMLRHTYATILHGAGVDLKTAQYLLGHSDIRMTANIYTHIEKGQTESAVNKIELFLNPQSKKENEEKKTP